MCAVYAVAMTATKAAKTAKEAAGQIPSEAPRYTNEQIINAATGRWGEVCDGIKPAEPYVIVKPDGNTITISPLTRRRRKKLKTAQAAYLLSAAQLAQVTRDDTADQKMIDTIEKLTDEAERTYDEALFGDDVVDEVYAYFDDLQEEFWDAFYQDVHNKLVNRTEDLPAGDAEAEGKDDSSSTSSSDSGTKSTETSDTSSTD